MKRNIFIAVLGMFVLTVQAQWVGSLEDLKVVLGKQESGLVEGYGKELGVLLNGMKKKGDLDGYLVVDTEKKRLEKEKTVPTVSAAKSAYYGAVVNYVKTRLTMLKKYDIALDTFIKVELMSDRIDSAKAGRDEKSRLAFDLTDMENQLPKEVVKVAETNAVKAVEGMSDIRRKKIEVALIGKWNIINSSGYRGVWDFRKDGTVMPSVGSSSGSWTIENSRVFIKWSDKWWDSFYFPISKSVRGDSSGSRGVVRATKLE